MSPLYKKIQVPLDGSALAVQALPHAEEIAQGSGAQLILLRVIERHLVIGAMPGIGSYGMGGGMGVEAVGVVDAAVDDAAQQQAMDEAQAALAAQIASLHRGKANAVADVLTGDPATAIIDYAEANNVDLIVMSTHGRTGMARWRFGSVAQKVLHGASCAVVVRPSFA